MDAEEIVASIGEKRVAEEGELEFPARKRRLRDVTRAAEIVLVLAAMGEMRAGLGPTDEEREMMAEARTKLVRACEEFAPKDVFPRDAFGAVIEDIGLDRLREKKIGPRPQNMSIMEKFLVTKHKRFQTNSGASAEGPGTLHATKTPASDKPSHSTIPSGRAQPASPLGHVSTGNPSSLVYQLPASEVKAPSSRVSTRLLGRDSSASAVPRVDRPDFRPESRSNSSSYASPIKVHPTGSPALQKPSHFPQQIQSSLTDKSRPDNKVLSHPLSKVDGLAVGSMSRAGPQASKPLPTQATSGHFVTVAQPVRGMNMTQGPSLSNPHIEIGRIVQKILQSQIPKYPNWNPPSRDYMNKSIPCQMCKVTINEMENALVCDACEKGYHIRCVESYDQKGVSKGEWHCFKCLSLSNGKPLPPKYGRVTRSLSGQKMNSNTAAVQSSAAKKVEKFGEKENQSKLIANGSSDLKSSMGSKHTNLETEFNVPNGRETYGNDNSSRKENKNDKIPFKNFPDDGSRCSASGCTSDSAVELERQPFIKSSETGSKMLNHLQLLNNVQEVLPVKPGSLHGNLNAVIRRDERGIVRYEPNDLSGDRVVGSERSCLPVHVSDNVDWIGDVLQVMDEKIYYQSCCVDGVVYKVQDHAFLYYNGTNDKLTPSKLQAMWEDRRTGNKWVIANRCYFHGDLPKAVGCPFSPESNEVYESNHGITVVAGLIRGPCEVLPPAKYIEESQRRSRLGSRENNGLRQLFLCKWFFDEWKGSFRDVSC